MIFAAAFLFSARLLAAQDQEPFILRGAAVSFGTGRAVTAALTYDPQRAAQGGFIYALRRLSDSDAERLSEAMILSAASRWSRGASQARARRIAVIVLDQARWEGGALVVEAPVLSPPIRAASGIAYQVVEKTVVVKLKEGDAVTVDPERGGLVLHQAEAAPAVLAAAAALRAFDGLKDGQALLQWRRSHQDEPRAGMLLVVGLAERLALGEAKPEDFERLKREVESSLAGPEKRFLSAELACVMSESDQRARDFLEESLDAAREAATIPAADRVEAEARRRWEGLKALGAGSARVDRLWRKIEAVVSARRGRLPPGSGDSLPEAAACVGASIPRRVALDSSWWRRFAQESRIRSRLAEIEEDASLGLRRKSQRIRALIASSPIDPESALGRDILKLLPEAGAYEVSGAFESFNKVSRTEVLEKILAVWMSCWDPAPLGRYRRSGKSEPDISVSVAAQAPADVSGRAFSRDPVSGRRDRIVVEVSKPGREPDEYALDRSSGREISPAVLGPGGRLLQDKDLERLAKASRVLDGHFGRGVELEFAFAEGKLYLLGVRPIPGIEEEPARASSFAAIPQLPAMVPAVKPVR